MINFNTNTGNNPEWLTPPFITDFFNFDLDPCSPKIRPWNTAKKHYFEKGLESIWEGFVFCNPPYGKETFKWMNKCAKHNNCIGLIFARTETIGFHAEVWNKATSMFFFKGRLKFYYVDGTQAKAPANAPSVLIGYGEKADSELLLFSKEYNGKYIKL